MLFVAQVSALGYFCAVAGCQSEKIEIECEIEALFILELKNTSITESYALLSAAGPAERVLVTYEPDDFRVRGQLFTYSAQRDKAMWDDGGSSLLEANTPEGGQGSRGFVKTWLKAQSLDGSVDSKALQLSQSTVFNADPGSNVVRNTRERSKEGMPYAQIILGRPVEIDRYIVIGGLVMTGNEPRRYCIARYQRRSNKYVLFDKLEYYPPTWPMRPVGPVRGSDKR